MKRKVIALTMAAIMVASLGACGGGAEDSETSADSYKDPENLEELDYEFGEDQTFHSDEPVEYSMLFSDHENYPYKEDWRLWSAIEEKTNVTFDLTLVARTDYNDKVSALVNSGDAPWIIPKTYDASNFVDSGQIVPISDWVQYMPNYMKAVEDWGMEEELKTTYQSDGKYYRLPGMWEVAAGGYSLIIRKDIFEAAGVNVEELEKNWTWDDFYDALLKVKEYTGADYVWSDQYQLGSTMNISGCEYQIKAGNSTDGGDWGLKNGVKFDWDKNEFYFTNTTDTYRDYLRMWNKMYKDGILDPETFSQDSTQAQAKFFRGDSYVLNANYQQLADIQSANKMQVDGAELYMIVYPGGPAGHLQVETSRLENGIMISQSALDELGTEGFVKMLRFIDWLWYSPEGQMLCQWGVEGETYTLDDDGNVVLNPDIYYNGINPGASKQLNVDYGFGGGVFAYGGSEWLRFSKFTDAEKDWNQRVLENTEPQKLDPPIMADEMEKEEMSLIQVPLMDYVNQSALQFITGDLDIENDWDAYVAECESKGCQKYVDQANEIFENTKDILGM